MEAVFLALSTIQFFVIAALLLERRNLRRRLEEYDRRKLYSMYEEFRMHSPHVTFEQFEAHMKKALTKVGIR